VKALLDQLRVSQAWKEIAAPPAPEIGSSSGDPEEGGASPVNPVFPPSASTSTSVASLLSQLQASPSLTPPTSTRNRDDGRSVTPSPQFYDPSPSQAAAAAVLPSPRKKDTRAYTFQQALPHIVQLANDPGFVAAVRQV
jgi:hypothetical protein